MRPRRGAGTGGGWAPALTPRTAVRIAILGGIAMTLLGLLLVRLWFLQVISGEQYAERADGNRLRTVVTEPPRGNILDRNGAALGTNRQGENVTARPRELTGERRRQVLRRLAPLLGVPLAELERRMTAGDDRPLEPVILARNVDGPLYRYLAEYRRDFPGISLDPTYLRAYPEGATAAHVLGSTGRITPEQIADYRSRGYSGNETIGTGGIEQQYERFLAGEPGRAVVEVDASGEPRGREYVSLDSPVPGRNIQLSIDTPTQTALERSIAEAAERQGAPGASGVALDPATGEVLAIASYPTFSPEVFVKRDDRAVGALLEDERTPLLNRAIGGTYPAASTFKPITAAAALKAGVLSVGESIESPSQVELYDQVFRNFRGNSQGFVTLPTALQVSSDTYFYQVADRLWQAQDGDRNRFPLSDMARDFGLGEPTGIDVPGEEAGTVPDPPWKKRAFAGVNPATGERYSDFDRSWLAGDTIQLGIGQGYLLVTPLQMAVAYAAIANGGTVVTPSVARQVQDPNGRVVRRLSEGRPTRELDLRPETIAALRQGLYEASNGPEGTATSVFANLPDDVEVAGKTGTAEQFSGQDRRDHSWFVGFAPFDDPEIVVAVVIERGGTGSNAAAPAVCRTIAAWRASFDPELCGVPVEETN
jgi:penicillin-binding protein 2